MNVEDKQEMSMSVYISIFIVCVIWCIFFFFKRLGSKFLFSYFFVFFRKIIAYRCIMCILFMTKYNKIR